MRKNLLQWIFLLGIVLSIGCKTNVTSDSGDAAQVDGHPAWIMQGNIYEVNLRQYTSEGTFKAFENHLQRLKDMGVQTLLFMPINPISSKDRKGALGNYYAVSDYSTVNPAFGSMDDWKSLVKKAHDMGLKIVIDWAANYTGADHKWLTSNSDFYLRDNSGAPMLPGEGMTDVRKLNYRNASLVDSMVSVMKMWIKETDIDGFRIDAATEVSRNFFVKAIPELKKQKNVLLIADANDASLHDVGFDITYTADILTAMNQIAQGQRKPNELDSFITKVETNYPATALKLYYTSNHTENTKMADYGMMPKLVHAPFAVLTQTLPRSIPLVYGGQEEPLMDSLSSYNKSSIKFGDYKRASFYKALLNARKNNPALAANSSFMKIETNMDYNIYAFMRTKDDKKVLVLVNLTDIPQSFKLKSSLANGSVTNIFTGEAKDIDISNNIYLPDWGYAVYEYK
jgi:alpha-amylase